MEAAMSLAAHRPQIPGEWHHQFPPLISPLHLVTVADAQIPTEAIVCAIAAAKLPPCGEVAVPPAATETMDVRATPNGSDTEHDHTLAGDLKSNDPPVQSDEPPEQPQPGPQ